MFDCNVLSAVSLSASLPSTSCWINARAAASAEAWAVSADMLASMFDCNVLSAASLSNSFWSTSAWTSSMFSWSESAAVVNCPNDARWVEAVASEAVTFPDTVTSPVTLTLAPSVVSPATFRVPAIVAFPPTLRLSFTSASPAHKSSIFASGEVRLFVICAFWASR